MIWPGQKFCNNDAFTEAKCQFEPRRSQSQFTIITALVLQIILPYQNPVRARGGRAGGRGDKYAGRGFGTKFKVWGPGRRSDQKEGAVAGVRA